MLMVRIIRTNEYNVWWSAELLYVIASGTCSYHCYCLHSKRNINRCVWDEGAEFTGRNRRPITHKFFIKQP